MTSTRLRTAGWLVFPTWTSLIAMYAPTSSHGSATWFLNSISMESGSTLSLKCPRISGQSILKQLASSRWARCSMAISVLSLTTKTTWRVSLTTQCSSRFTMCLARANRCTRSAKLTIKSNKPSRMLMLLVRSWITTTTLGG